MGAVRSPKRKAPRGAGLGPTWNRAERVRSQVIGGAEYLIETKRPSATNLDRIQPGIRKIGTQPVQQF